MSIEVDIKITPPPVKSKTQGRRSVGLIPKKEDDVLKRRLSKSIIKLYDLGRKWNGSEFVDVEFTYPITTTTPPGSHPFVNRSVNPLVGQALEDAIFDYDINLIDTKHPLLGTADEGSLYYFNLYVVDPDFFPFGLILALDSSSEDGNWTTKGWRVTKKILEDIRLQFVHPSVGFDNVSPHLYSAPILAGTGKNKVTAIRSFSSPAVTYVPANKDQIFLMPKLISPEIQIEYIESIGYPDGNPPEDFLVSQYYNLDFGLVKRVPFLDPEDPNYLRGIFEASGFEPPTEPDYLRLQDLFFERGYYSNPVAHRNIFAIGSYVWDFQTGAPNPAILPTSIPNVQRYTIRPYLGGVSGVPFHLLIAVVKRKTQLFYIWS